MKSALAAARKEISTHGTVRHIVMRVFGHAVCHRGPGELPIDDELQAAVAAARSLPSRPWQLNKPKAGLADQGTRSRAHGGCVAGRAWVGHRHGPPGPSHARAVPRRETGLIGTSHSDTTGMSGARTASCFGTMDRQG